MEQLAHVFSLIVQPAYDLTGSWWAAIFLFTLATKIILMPLALWTQQNSIVMVRLMPETFRLKTRYFGDRETIEERSNELNKKAGYHPLLSLIPLAIQVVILFGLVDVIHGITDSGAPGTEFLGMTPIIDGGITWIMPLAAALSSVALGLASNKLNPLQREQSRAEKNTTNGLSIAMSLVLAVYVVCGMAFYWVCSNLLSILVQIVCNIIIDPRKQVDYDDLNAARDEFEAMDAATKSTHKWFQRDPHAAREKEDYKRFFDTIGKHLVFYSESSGFYKYFQGAIEWLLANSDIRIHYVTSDPNDQVFELAKQQPRLIPYYLGQRRLITLFMKLDADVVVTSLGDLESSYMKRSYVRKDAEYMYMCHHMTSMTVTSTRNEYTYYDDVLCVGPHQQHDLELVEKYYGTPSKRKPAIGYDLLDRSIKNYQKQNLGQRKPGEKPLLLIGPSWQYDNLMDSCLDGLLEQLMGRGWRIVVRPHPEYLKRYPARMEEILARYADADPEELSFETDFSSNTSVLSADLLFTDWSSVAEEFSFTTLKPSVFIDTAMKENNPDWSKIHSDPCDITLRNEIGRSFDPKDLSGLGDAVAQMLDETDSWSHKIEEIRNNMIFNLGHGGEAAGKFILERVLAHQEEAAADAADDATTKKNAAADAADDAEKSDAVSSTKDATKTTDEDGVSRD
ncbi:membrane protein [Lancefieldella parvula DNF00906]|jgi:60 kDa inner membrane insertion protein|uniref:YidC/Oxa1 family membrane protein insertase n=1 Tax=Lancefieldella parvula TaxID=1382 RepID=UPI00050F0A09|nr:YidC/Oxa1 family membrane protein insertase [Lancefieldella parvula]KGF13301.1 membrane protein [Lancefieldella parvula DNF00906]